MTDRMIYLDNNATTRLDGRVLQFMMPYLTDEYANSGSAHLFGLSVAEAVDNAQQDVARLIGCRPSELVFTSGATESVNSVIKGVSSGRRRHIVSIATEHKAVRDTCRFMETRGFTFTEVPVLSDGTVDLNVFKDAITADTLLVCAMLANNETGVLHPIEDMTKIAHESGALFLCDATQAVGKIPVDVKQLGVDFLAFSAHKFYGPKGIGALYTKSDAGALLPLIHGGGQQRSRRSGTLNAPAAIGFGKACEIALAEMPSDSARIGKLRDRLETKLLAIGKSFVNGNLSQRLHNTTNICFPGIESEQVILRLKNVCVSNGSACSSVSTTPSHVLKAMGLTDENAFASLRLSLGRFTSESEIDEAADRIAQLVSELRS